VGYVSNRKPNGCNKIRPCYFPVYQVARLLRDGAALIANVNRAPSLPTLCSVLAGIGWNLPGWPLLVVLVQGRRFRQRHSAVSV